MAEYRLNSLSSDDQDENNLPRRGLVTDVCREWTMHEDQALAYKLQNEEYDQHLGHNKSRNALLRHDTPHARQEQVKVDEEAARQHQRMLEELDRQEAADAALAANVAARLEEEECQRQLEIEKRDEELAKKMAAEERARIKEKKELKQVEREAAYLGINTGRDNVALLAAHTDSAETETAAASAAARQLNRRSGSRPPPLDLADLNDLSDFCLRPSRDMGEEEARRFQEEQDAEVARLLGDQELKRRGDCLPKDQLMAIQAQDQELAKVLQEQERAKAKKAREKARQKALQKKQLKRQRQEEERLQRHVLQASADGGEGSSSSVVAAQIHDPRPVAVSPSRRHPPSPPQEAALPHLHHTSYDPPGSPDSAAHGHLQLSCVHSLESLGDSGQLDNAVPHSEGPQLLASDASLSSHDPHQSSNDRRQFLRDSNLTSIEPRLTSKDDRLTSNDSRLTAKDDRLTSNDSQLTAKDNHLTSNDSRLTAKNSRSTSKDHRFTPRSPDLYADVTHSSSNNLGPLNDTRLFQSDRQASHQSPNKFLESRIPEGEAPPVDRISSPNFKSPHSNEVVREPVMILHRADNKASSAFISVQSASHARANLQSQHRSPNLSLSSPTSLAQPEPEHLYDTPADDLAQSEISNNRDPLAATLKSRAPLRTVVNEISVEKETLISRDVHYDHSLDTVEPYASQPIGLQRIIPPRCAPLPRIPSPLSSHNTTQDSSYDDLGHHYDTPSLLFAAGAPDSNTSAPGLRSPTFQNSPVSAGSPAPPILARPRSLVHSSDNYHHSRSPIGISPLPPMSAAHNQNLSTPSHSRVSSFENIDRATDPNRNIDSRSPTGRLRSPDRYDRPITTSPSHVTQLRGLSPSALFPRVDVRVASPLTTADYNSQRGLSPQSLSPRDVSQGGTSPRGMSSRETSPRNISPRNMSARGIPIRNCGGGIDVPLQPDISHTPDAKHTLAQARPRSVAEVMTQLQRVHVGDDRRCSVGALLEDRLPPYRHKQDVVIGGSPSQRSLSPLAPAPAPMSRVSPSLASHVFSSSVSPSPVCVSSSLAGNVSPPTASHVSPSTASHVSSTASHVSLSTASPSHDPPRPISASSSSNFSPSSSHCSDHAVASVNSITSAPQQPPSAHLPPRQQLEHQMTQHQHQITQHQHQMTQHQHQMTQHQQQMTHHQHQKLTMQHHQMITQEQMLAQQHQLAQQRQHQYQLAQQQHSSQLLHSQQLSQQHQALPPLQQHRALPSSQSQQALPPSQHRLKLPKSQQHQALPPSQQHQALPPSQQHQALPPSQQHQALAPSQQHQALAPSQQHQALPPSQQHQASSPSQQHQALAPSQEHQALAPSQQHQAVGPSQQHKALAPSQQHQAMPPSQQHPALPPMQHPHHHNHHQFTNIACAIDPTYQRRVMEGDLPPMGALHAQTNRHHHHHHHHPPHLLHHHPHTHHHHPDELQLLQQQQQMMHMQHQQGQLQQGDKQHQYNQLQQQAFLHDHELQQQYQLQQRMFMQQQQLQGHLLSSEPQSECPAPPYMPLHGQRRLLDRTPPRLAELLGDGDGGAAGEVAPSKLRLGRGGGKQGSGCKQQ